MTSAPIKGDLKSVKQLEVAYALSDMQIAEITRIDNVVAEKLKTVRDVVWQLPDESVPLEARNEAKEKVFKESLKDLSAEQSKRLVASYSRMGSLYEVAGLTARDNYFKQRTGSIPGGVEEFVGEQVKKNESVDNIITKLGVPVFEPVLTMHPTSVKALAPTQALRKLSVALHDDHGEEAIAKAVADYQNTAILHEVDGKSASMTVRDENKMVLNSIGYIYDDAPRIFAQYDQPLKKQFQDKYHPLELKLQARFGSWSPGDKDGNPNITSEKTLEAVARHTHDIVERYSKELEAINAPELEPWKEKIRNVGDKLGKDNGLLKSIENLADKSDSLRARTDNEALAEAKKYSKHFDTFSSRLAKLRKTLNAEEFEKALIAAYENTQDETQKEKILELTRKVRWFGFSFAKIEYRDKAEEYTTAISEIIPGYDALSSQQRIDTLTDLLNQDSLRPEMYTKVKDIVSDGANKQLSDKNSAGAKAYHTIRRMQLASDFGDMIKDNVLAECGIVKGEATEESVVAQGVSNILEAQFLQRVVKDDEKGRKAALLGIVPLFEDPNTMEYIDKIMKAAYDNPAYQKHMQALATDRYDSKATQQLQIAHSDNRRRSGSPAGTAFIHEAHQKIRDLHAQPYEWNGGKPINSQFYQGGSLSDAFRNGVRAISAQVNAFGMHDFAKFTFQGGDMLNYFNHPNSNERVFTRNFVQPASRVNIDAQTQEVTIGRNGLGDEAFVKGIKHDRRPNKIIQEVAIEALKNTRKDYAEHDFTKEALGTLYAALGLGYDIEANAVNVGSRPTKRLAFGTNSTTSVGAVIPVDVEAVRTISFSMTPQFNHLITSPVGAIDLGKHVKAAIIKRVNDISNSNREPSEDEKFFMDNFGDVNAVKEVQPSHMALLYDKSPAFRDVIDKSAFAIARSDLDLVSEDVASKLAARDGDSQEQADIRTGGRSYVERLKKTFKNMGNIAYEAIMGDPSNNTTFDQPLSSDRLRPRPNAPSRFLRRDSDNASMQAAAMESLNGLGEEIWLKNNYHDFVTYAKKTLIPEYKEGDKELLATILSGGLTATHGRFLHGDDPTYAKQYSKDQEQSYALSA